MFLKLTVYWPKVSTTTEAARVKTACELRSANKLHEITNMNFSVFPPRTVLYSHMPCSYELVLFCYSSLLYLRHSLCCSSLCSVVCVHSAAMYLQ